MSLAPQRIAVICGGPAAEADVSRRTAAEVATALNSRGHEVRQFELDSMLPDALLRWQPALVFPALHGRIGEDGTIQGFLEILELPYVGSNVHGSATAMDKILAKQVFQRVGLPVAADLDSNRWSSDTAVATITAEITAALGPSVVLKPRNEGSALGVSRLHSRLALAEAVNAAHDFSAGWLVETFIEGAEATVGILDLEGTPAVCMPPIEIVTAPGEWYDFENRYAEGKSEHIMPARFGNAVNERLSAIALTAHRALGLRDLSRSDFIVAANGEPILLETNTMPGMTRTSLYPDGAQALGYTFPSLMEALCASALRRYAKRSASRAADAASPTPAVSGPGAT